MKKLKEKSLFGAKRQKQTQILHLPESYKQKNGTSFNIFSTKHTLYLIKKCNILFYYSSYLCMVS